MLIMAQHFHTEGVEQLLRLEQSVSI